MFCYHFHTPCKTVCLSCLYINVFFCYHRLQQVQNWFKTRNHTFANVKKNWDVEAVCIENDCKWTSANKHFYTIWQYTSPIVNSPFRWTRGWGGSYGSQTGGLGSSAKYSASDLYVHSKKIRAKKSAVHWKVSVTRMHSRAYKELELQCFIKRKRKHAQTTTLP